MKLSEIIQKPTVRKIIDHCVSNGVWSVIVILTSVVVIKWGLGSLVELIGSPRPLLFATVNCENWKSPCCIDEELKGLNNNLFLDNAHSSDIKCLLCAESMYTINVLNRGDKEATNPILTIEDNLYSEVIRRIGKGDKTSPEKHFMPKEVKLGLIQAGKTVAVEVKAWISSQPNRSRAKKIEITCEGRPASLCIETPLRIPPRWFNKHFWKTIILTPLALLLFHLFMRIRRGNIINSNKPEPQPK